MKIEQADVALSAAHSFSSECKLSIESASSFRTVFAEVARGESLAAAEHTDSPTKSRVLLEQLIAHMLEFILGQRDPQITDVREVLRADAPAAARVAQRPQREIIMEWSTQTTESVREQERSDFSSSGRVLTADGRTLDFRLDLSLSRDYQAERISAAHEKIVLRDPLVVNFGGTAAEFSGKRFAFDLDADGTDETLRALAPGCGFLALDANCNGRIDDGSELFGALSGNGFADLAQLDGDGNFWLDEVDSAFADLRVWQFDATGKDSLTSLREQGVGALYLGSIETPFTLTDGENRTLAQVRASGFYLGDDGKAGAVQQIDLAV